MGTREKGDNILYLHIVTFHNNSCYKYANFQKIYTSSVSIYLLVQFIFLFKTVHKNEVNGREQCGTETRNFEDNTLTTSAALGVNQSQLDVFSYENVISTQWLAFTGHLQMTN